MANLPAPTKGYPIEARAPVAAHYLDANTIAVAKLPPPNASRIGTRMVVGDALTPAYLSTVVGGGSVICPVFCNGTNWVCV